MLWLGIMPFPLETRPGPARVKRCPVPPVNLKVDILNRDFWMEKQYRDSEGN